MFRTPGLALAKQLNRTLNTTAPAAFSNCSQARFASHLLALKPDRVSQHVNTTTVYWQYQQTVSKSKSSKKNTTGTVRSSINEKNENNDEEENGNDDDNDNDDSDEEDEDVTDDAEIDDLVNSMALKPGYKVIKKHVPSLRIDSLLASGLTTSRNKIDGLFYSGRLRINGNKVTKKSIQVAENDRLDLIGDVDEKAGKRTLKRVILLKKVDAKSATHKPLVYLLVWKGGLYEEDSYKK